MSSDKVAVIGGGPGGLRAAQCVAEIGGEVVLVEQRDFLGGTPVAENYAGLTPRGEPAQPQIRATRSPPIGSSKSGSAPS